MAENRQRIAENLAAVEARLADACWRSGRVRDEVVLIAVTKTISGEAAALLPELGMYDLGESRPQELWRKASTITDVRWHFIGHLQRNKIERTLPLVQRIHSVDSLRLLHALESAAENLATIKPLSVMLEFNVSGEASKHGFAPADVEELAPALAKLEHLHVDGLMTMAAYEDDPERTRPTFASLRLLRDRLESKLGRPLPQLSMGMSSDYEIAIEEGATMIRLGTVLFTGISE